jgi:hypothetical protein
MNRIALTVARRSVGASHLVAAPPLTESAAGGMPIATILFMECFFGSYELPSDSRQDKSAVVTFTIPDVGITFKAPFDASTGDHGDFASLLALLDFIDSNQKYFSNHTYQIYGNNHRVINAVNKVEHPPGEYAPLLNKALGYRDKYRFSLDWIAARDNPVYDQLFD